MTGVAGEDGGAGRQWNEAGWNRVPETKNGPGRMGRGKLCGIGMADLFRLVNYFDGGNRGVVHNGLERDVELALGRRLQVMKRLG